MSKAENVKPLVSKRLLWATVFMALVAPKLVAEYAYWTIVDNRRSTNAQLKALRTLEGMGYFGRGPLLRLLRHKNVGNRMQAARSLGHHSGRAVVDALIGAAREDKNSVQNEALRSLGRIGDSRAIPAMEELAAETVFAHEPLLWMGPEGRDALIGVIDDEGAVADARGHALGQLCSSREFRDDRATADCVERALKAPAVDVREAAVLCLGEIAQGSPERAAVFLEDESAEVKVSAARALRRLGVMTGRRVLRLVAQDLTASAEARRKAVRELGQYEDSEDVERLREVAKNDPSRMVRETAQIALQLLED